MTTPEMLLTALGLDVKKGKYASIATKHAMLECALDTTANSVAIDLPPLTAQPDAERDALITRMHSFWAKLVDEKQRDSKEKVYGGETKGHDDFMAKYKEADEGDPKEIKKCLDGFEAGFKDALTRHKEANEAILKALKEEMQKW